MTPEQAATLSAVVDTIVPADECPSGTQAGVLDYLEGRVDLRAFFAAGLDAVEAEAWERYGAPFPVLGRLSIVPGPCRRGRRCPDPAAAPGHVPRSLKHEVLTW